MKKNNILILLSIMFLFNTNLFAKKKDVHVENIVKGSYLDYYPKSLKNQIYRVSTLNYIDWVGSLYAKKHKINQNIMLTRARQNAKDYAIGFADGFLDKDYNPEDYYIIIDHYNVVYTEYDYKLQTLVTGNIILIKK